MNLAALALVAAPLWTSGFYAEAGLGASGFLGQTAEYAALGPSVGLRLGYGLTRWFAVGGIVSAATHEATVPPPPEDEFFQLYRLGATARLTLPVGRISIFADGALGAAFVSTNVLDKVEVTQPESHAGLFTSAGGGLAYHIQSRHFSLGVAGEWTLYPAFAASQAVGVRVFLRYVK